MNSKEIIPLSAPSFIDKASERIGASLETGWVSSAGPDVVTLEKSLSEYLGAKHVIAVNSGTAALHLSMLAASIGPGDAVLVPGLSFIASVNPVKYVGAEPVFIDVDPKSWTISVELVKDYLENHCKKEGQALYTKSSGSRVRALVLVHTFGVPAPVSELVSLAKEYNLLVIEDSAEGLGSSLNGQMLGSFGEFGALSFNGNKILTTGAGGAVVTKTEEAAQRVLHLSTQAKQDPLKYVHDEVGYNYRMSNLNAALGLSQLENFQAMLAGRKRVFQNYQSALSEYVDREIIEFQVTPKGALSNYWLTCVLISKSGDDQPAFGIVDALREEGILARPIWAPLFDQTPYLKAERVGGDVTRQLCSKGVCLPSSAHLSEDQQARVVECLKSLLD